MTRLVAVFAVAALLFAASHASVASPADASPEVAVEALFTDAAVLRINGERKMLKSGQTYKGVTLLAAHAQVATLDVAGQVMEMGLSRRVGTRYATPDAQVVTIPRDAMMQYQTNASINGRSMQVLVDTGANVVALNSAHAAALGLDYTAGARTRVETASGKVNAWLVTLASVDVGGIRVDNVQATVVEGGFPSTILLGMTYLRHVQMDETGGILSLSRAW